jgi:hypothetical protein
MTLDRIKNVGAAPHIRRHDGHPDLCPSVEVEMTDFCDGYIEPSP